MTLFNSQQHEFEIETDVYCRVSSEDQQERETIENQIEFAIKYCDLHRLRIRNWYKDDGVSGTVPLDQRPDGKRLIEDAKAGKVRMVLIYNMKRLGRKARITLDAVYQLEQYGVKVKSMTEPFDTSDPVGRFIITVLAGQAELDRDTMLETMWHGANRAARKGKWLGGVVPYGYFKNDEGFLEVNEELIPGFHLSEAGVVRLMFDLLADHKWTTIRVADYFNSLSLPTSYIRDGRKVKKGKRKEKTAGVWTPGRINSMAHNTTYKGIHLYGKRGTRAKELIEREVPAIVSPAKWDAAIAVIKSNQLESFKGESRTYLLRSLIKCESCGRIYHGTQYKGSKGELKAYYVCGGKNPYGNKKKCQSRNVPALWLEEQVWQQCFEFITNPGSLINELSGNMDKKKSIKHSLENELQMLKKSIADKDNERQEVISLFRRKVISSIDVEKQLQEIMIEKDSLEKRVKEILNQLEQENDLTQQYDSAEMLLNDLREKLHDNPSPELKREIIKTLVNEIVVLSDETDSETDSNTVFIRKRDVNIKVVYGFFIPRQL